MSMANLEISLLRSFVEISRAGTLKGAAERIGRTQSAVSLQLKRLEEVVGEPLFHRTGSGVVLTTSGDRLMAGAERVLAAHDDALAEFRSKGLRGAISFGCPEDYLTAFFSDLLRRFGKEHPAVEIELVSAPTVDLHPLLQRRRIDLGLVSVAGSTASQDILRQEPLVWIAESPQPALLQEAVLPLAMSAPDTLDHQLAHAAIKESGIPYRIAHASNGLAGLLAIARSGLAVSVVTRGAVPADLHIVAHGLPALARVGMALIYASTRPTPAVKAFGEFVASAIVNLPEPQVACAISDGVDA